jgi:hypothetical protein
MIEIDKGVIEEIAKNVPKDAKRALDAIITFLPGIQTYKEILFALALENIEEEEQKKNLEAVEDSFANSTPQQQLKSFGELVIKFCYLYAKLYWYVKTSYEVAMQESDKGEAKS